MPAEAFLDTNILIYALNNSGPKTFIAEALLFDGCTIGVQSLNELVSVASRKLRKPWLDILSWLTVIYKLCPPPVPLTQAVHYCGLHIAQAHGYHIYDSMLLAAALESGCTVFYSEDLQDGHVIDGLTIRNPFAAEHTN